MQTRFTDGQMADPQIVSSESVIRKCVHCGFCTATCPTYVLLGDELDSPRGRIYLIKNMLEAEAAPTAEVVKHIDRCLSCLSCMTTCPSGVNYMHLIDHARSYIEDRYRRPLQERLVRAVLAWVLPYPKRFRVALAMARLVKPIEPIFAPTKSLAAMLALAPKRPARRPAPVAPFPGRPQRRVALLRGCAEPVLRPEIREAASRLLARMRQEVVLAPDEGCCGALVHHMGRQEAALDAARRNVDVWSKEIETRGLDAIVVTASGCGTTIKDYGFMLRQEPAYAERAAKVSALARDISELIAEAGLPSVSGAAPLTVAYHSACSLQHGQRISDVPQRLLEEAGFVVKTPREAHLCCGSAGVYNILQPQLADQIGERKVENLERLRPDVIATGNIGCATQIEAKSRIPVVHTVELLDWATGGPVPERLSRLCADSLRPSGRECRLPAEE